MTTGTKVHQALGMMKMLSGNFHTFAMDTQDPMAKQMYTGFSTQMDQMVNDFANRINYIEQQEPQYKMENMAQQQADMAHNNQQSMQKE